jgi:hypothetical protein
MRRTVITFRQYCARRPGFPSGTGRPASSLRPRATRQLAPRSGPQAPPGVRRRAAGRQMECPGNRAGLWAFCAYGGSPFDECEKGKFGALLKDRLGRRFPRGALEGSDPPLALRAWLVVVGAGGAAEGLPDVR